MEVMLVVQIRNNQYPHKVFLILLGGCSAFLGMILRSVLMEYEHLMAVLKSTMNSGKKTPSPTRVVARILLRSKVVSALEKLPTNAAAIHSMIATVAEVSKNMFLALDQKEVETTINLKNARTTAASYSGSAYLQCQQQCNQKY